MADIDWFPGALAALAASDEVADLLDRTAVDIRDLARRNAAAHYPASSRIRGIAADSGADAAGVYADVGYAKHHPGFVLWWSEVGTVTMSARPHLRAAVQQTRL